MSPTSGSITGVSFQLPNEPVAQTIGQRVAGMIRDAIVRGELTGGQSLRQEELAARFQISRIPLRDALQQLEKDGFVVILPYRGAAVAPVSMAESREIVELMVALHSLTLRLAFPHLTAEIFDQIEQIGEARKSATEVCHWARLSVEYWSLLLFPAHRPLLFNMLNDLHSQAVRYASYYHPVWMKNERLRDLYLEITRACRSGNLEAAIESVEQGYWLGGNQLADDLAQAGRSRIGDGAMGLELPQRVRRGRKKASRNEPREDSSPAGSE